MRVFKSTLPLASITFSRRQRLILWPGSNRRDRHSKDSKFEEDGNRAAFEKLSGVVRQSTQDRPRKAEHWKKPGVCLRCYPAERQPDKKPYDCDILLHLSLSLGLAHHTAFIQKAIQHRWLVNYNGARVVPVTWHRVLQRGHIYARVHRLDNYITLDDNYVQKWHNLASKICAQCFICLDGLVNVFILFLGHPSCVYTNVWLSG